MGKDLTKRAVQLRAGDLVVKQNPSKAGILMQKHKVLRNRELDGEMVMSRWYFAWRVKWNREADKKETVRWIELLDEQIDEEKLLNDIKSGRIEHYSSDNTECN